MPDPESNLETSLSSWADDVTAMTDAPDPDAIVRRAGEITRRRRVGALGVLVASVLLGVVVVGPWRNSPQEVRSADHPDDIQPTLVETGRAPVGDVWAAEPGPDGSLYASTIGEGVVRLDADMNVDTLLEPGSAASSSIDADSAGRWFVIGAKPGPTFPGDDDPTFIPTLVEINPSGGGRVLHEFDDEVVIAGGGVLDVAGTSAVAAFDESLYRVELSTESVAAVAELDSIVRHVAQTTDSIWASTSEALYELDPTTLETRRRLGQLADARLAVVDDNLVASGSQGQLFLVSDTAAPIASDISALALVSDGMRLWASSTDFQLALIGADGVEVQRFTLEGSRQLIVGAQDDVIWTVSISDGVLIRYEVRGLDRTDPTTAPTTVQDDTATTAVPAETPTLTDRQLVDSFLSFARSPSEATLAALPLAPEVRLGLGPDLISTATAASLADPNSWDLDVEAFAGGEGPFSALDRAVDAGATTVTVGAHDRCASPPGPTPPEVEGLRRVSVQPDAESMSTCLQWWSVDFFVDNGAVVAITLDLWEP